MAWMLPDEDSRAERLSKLFAAEARYHHFAGGGVEVATDDNGVIGGATLWDPPGRWKQSWISGLVSLPPWCVSSAGGFDMRPRSAPFSKEHTRIRRTGISRRSGPAARRAVGIRQSTTELPVGAL
ncbi:hypothetical protein GCM10020255_091550 [Rhodococcus baikonurensis]